MMNVCTVFRLVGAVVCFYAPVLSAATHTIYVSPKGFEQGNGTKSRPVDSLMRAQELAAASKAEEKRVVLFDGVYLIDETIALGADSDGVSYRALHPKKAILIGGQYVKASRFKPVSDKRVLQRLPKEVRSKVKELDLKPLKLRRTGELEDLFSSGNGGTIDLYFNGRRLMPARWPNEGYTTMDEVLVNGHTSKPKGEPGQFVYRDDRAEHWVEAVEQGELFLRGFWRVPWVSQCVRVGAIDTKKKTMTHQVGIGGGIGSKYAKTVDGVRKGDGKELYYAFNLPEELDVPGEWYLNVKTQKLYLYPPSKMTDHSVLIADLNAPILSVTGARDVRIEHLVIEGGLMDAVRLSKCDKVRVAGCTIRKTGGVGLSIQEGKDCEILSNDLYHLGGMGMDITAGDRKSLSPANHRIENNKIYQFGEVATISVGIRLAGVGNTIAHNEIFEGNYGGISFGGNDHVMEYNELYHLGLDGGDYGFFYSNADWASAGSVVRYNFGHHASNGNFYYVDDGKSFEKGERNLVYKVSAGLFMGGGHKNEFWQNVVCDSGIALHMDDRGVSRKYDEKSQYHMRNYNAFAKDNELYTKKYPGIERIYLDDPTLPTGNVVHENMMIACKLNERFYGNKEHFVKMRVEGNQTLATLDVFKNPEKLDFSLRAPNTAPEPMAWLKDHFSKIGLYKDEYRTVLYDNPARYDFKQVVREFESIKDTEASNKNH